MFAGYADGEWLEAPLSTGTGVSSGRRFMGSGRISVDESRVLVSVHIALDWFCEQQAVIMVSL